MATITRAAPCLLNSCSVPLWPRAPAFYYCLACLNSEKSFPDFVPSMGSNYHLVVFVYPGRCLAGPHQRKGFPLSSNCSPENAKSMTHAQWPRYPPQTRRQGVPVSGCPSAIYTHMYRLMLMLASHKTNVVC